MTVAMSPLISPLRGPGSTWMPPAGWSLAQFQYLCGVDMDAVLPIGVDHINEYFTAWLTDRAPNRPIRINGTIFGPQNPDIGDATFGQARVAWQTLFPPGSVGGTV